MIKIILILLILVILSLLFLSIYKTYKHKELYRRRQSYNKDYYNKYKIINGKINLDNNKVYGITTIITTAPQPSIPSSKVIIETIRSLRLIPLIYNSQVIIGFDGCKVKNSKLHSKCKSIFSCSKYDKYINNVKRKAKEILPNVKFIVLSERNCLSNLVYNCMKEVKTSFVNVMQQDLPIKKTFDLGKVLSIMNKNSNMDIVRYSAKINIDHENWTESHCGHKFTPTKINIDNIDFTQCSQWSDQNHISKISHYREVVFKISKPYDFMEHQLRCYPIDTLYTKIWYLGNDNDSFCIHTDGRNVK